jgi:hypothetical protein
MGIRCRPIRTQRGDDGPAYLARLHALQLIEVKDGKWLTLPGAMRAQTMTKNREKRIDKPLLRARRRRRRRAALIDASEDLSLEFDREPLVDRAIYSLDRNRQQGRRFARQPWLRSNAPRTAAVNGSLEDLADKFIGQATY